MNPFIEKDCVIKIEGKSFESGGSFICECSDGYFRGVVYAKPDKRIVTTWHGEKIATASFGNIYNGNFSTMQSVSFVYEGIKFQGRYCPDWAEMVRVRGKIQR